MHDGFPRESRKDTVHRTVVVRPSQQMDRAARPPVTGVLRLPDEGKPTMQHAWPHRARRRSREPTTSQSVAARLVPILVVRSVGNTCRAAPRAQAQLPCSVSSRAACLRSPPLPAGCCRLASAASRPFPRAHAALRPLVGLSPGRCGSPLVTNASRGCWTEARETRSRPKTAAVSQTVRTRILRSHEGTART